MKEMRALMKKFAVGRKIFGVVGLVSLFAAITASTANAKITPGPLFTDNAVFQQKQAIPVWGNADPNEPITVSMNGESATTSADANGAWSVKLKAIPAGGPYTLTITGTPGDTLTLKNVLVGEVWLCGGQSNMQYCIGEAFGHDSSLKDSLADPMLHFVMIPHVVALTPQTTVEGGWQEASDHMNDNLTAVGFYFARELRKTLGVPVGLINDNWAGQSAQSFTSRDALQAAPELRHHLDREAAYATTEYPKALDDYKARVDKYNVEMAKFDADTAAAKAAGSPLPTNPPKTPWKPISPDQWLGGATRLYNGMIAPIIPYGIRGVIWYQGETNAMSTGGWDYKTLLPIMIKDWRTRWGQGDFPFLLVQLAPYKDITSTPQQKSGWAELREAQRLTAASLPNVGMAVITNLGDQKNIHPTRKKPVGERLALIARAQVYGEKNLEYTGPVFESIQVEGGKIRVKFTHADGLKAIDVHDVSDDGPIVASAGKLVGFEVAGSDGQYFTADAVIVGTSVVVSNAGVTAPVSVRYGWAEYPVCNLSNGAGLPASPFKTDDLPWSTTPKTTPPPVAK